MSGEGFSNNFSTTLAGAVAPMDATIQTNSIAPPELQNTSFRITTPTGEIMLVTGGQSTQTWQVLRGREGTTAGSYNPNDLIEHFLTAEAVRQLGYHTVSVGGAWDAVSNEQAADGVIAVGQLSQVTSSIVGPWAVGKKILVHGNGAGGGLVTLISTVQSTSGTTATMADLASDSIASGAVVKIGTDDTQAWLDAIAKLPTGTTGATLKARSGISMFGTLLRIPANCNFMGDGKGATLIQAISAAARIAWGPDFTHTGGGQPSSHGQNGSFTLDGGFIATQPLFINAVNGSFDDIGVVYGNGDNLICGGQNCTFDNLNSGGSVGACIVMDNGVGDYCFRKPECNAAGTYHLVIRSSYNAEGVGYGYPEYNYWEEGVFEGRNFVLPGSPGKGNVLISSGRNEYFKDMNFYMDAFNAGDPQSMVRIEGAGVGGNNNPDTAFQVNGDHVFRDCTWSGPGGATRQGYGIEADARIGGVAQQFNSVFYPYELQGLSKFTGLIAAELLGTTTPPRRHGNIFYF